MNMIMISHVKVTLFSNQSYFLHHYDKIDTQTNPLRHGYLFDLTKEDATNIYIWQVKLNFHCSNNLHNDPSFFY